MTKPASFPPALNSETVKVLQKIISDHPEFTFRFKSRFSFRSPRTIHLGPPEEPHYILLALHELGHALSEHKNYSTHVELLKMEREAWEKARSLCPLYHVEYDPDLVEEHLDSYRDWLHTKSLCPRCGLTRYQTPDGVYHCPHCELYTLPR